jgi:outer membrane protein assembly factor BamB
MKFSENNIRIIRGTGQVAGVFTVVIAVVMIFSLIQIKTIDPLNSPALSSVKDQFDSNQDDLKKAEQVRALDLMARRAYFASRRQVETGSYLLLAGAVIFVLCQQLIAGSQKINPEIPGSKPDPAAERNTYRKYLLVSSTVITAGAVVASFFLRSELPETRPKPVASVKAGSAFNHSDSFKPGSTNFPSFRGEDGRGIAGGKGFATSWDGSSGKNIKWKTAVPGNGKSSPVIWDDKIFLTGAEGTTCMVYCFDKLSGKVLWKESASGVPGEPAELPRMSGDGGLAVSTAAVNKNSVCAIFANGNLICLTHEGSKKWAMNIGVPGNTYGYSCSPIIFEKNLIVQYESEKKISLIAFDLESGKLVWETQRTGTPVWSSPVIAEFNGKKQIVVNGNPNVSGFDAETGKSLWSVECMSGDVAPSLAVNSSMVYAVTDFAKLCAVAPGPSPSVKWEDNSYLSDISSPVATDDFLFIATGYSEVACYNAQKGDTLWTHYFMDPFNASPVIADNMVWMLDKTGRMHIIRKSEKFELVGEPSLNEPSECTPAFSDGKIFIRGRNNLYCISTD